MKSKIISLLLAFTLILPLGAAANTGAVQSANVIDFTNDDSVLTLGYGTADPDSRGGHIAKGQYGKHADDASYRLFSTGGTAQSVESASGKSVATLKVANDGIAEAANGQFYHLGFQYLNEDGLSTLAAKIDYVSAATDETLSDVNIMSQPNDNFFRTRIFPNCDKVDGANQRYQYDGNVTGTWNQLDLYFSSADTGNTAIFINGESAVVSPTKWHMDKGSTVKKIESVTFTHTATTGNGWLPTGAQVDNVVFEVVDSVPSSHSVYRYGGDGFGFDDNVKLEDGKYKFWWYNSKTKVWEYRHRPNGVSYVSDTANTLKSGALGRPSWDKSLHTAVEADGSAMSYTPALKSLVSGDAPQLTFAIANGRTDAPAGVVAKGLKIGDSALEDISIFEMSSDGSFRFFGEDTNESWLEDTWYKVDVEFDIDSSATTACCYVDGELLYDGYVLSDGAMSAIGTLAFTDAEGADYWLDDVAFAMPAADPADGYTIDSSDPELGDAINNETKVITLSGTYKAEDFLKKIKNPETVTLYNSSGAIVYSGLLAQCSVKVSNTFGAGVWYTVETTGEVYDASLFDIADGSAVIVADVDTLNIDASSQARPVIKTDIYIDGELSDSINDDKASVDLSSLMFGVHTFEARAYINSKDCYIDSIELALVEDVETDIIADGANSFDSYTGGSYTMTGGKIVQQAYAGLAETVTDNSGKNYGTSAVFEAQQSLDTKGHSYVELTTDPTVGITKAFVEFDVCLLTDRVGMSISYQSTGATAGLVGASGKFGDNNFNMELKRWYHVTSMLDVKNKVASLWIDGEPVAENMTVAPTASTISSGIRLIVSHADRTQMANLGITARKLLAIDNITLSEYDELAYVKSVEDSLGNHPVDFTDDVLTVTMSAPVEEITADMLSLHSANGERAVESVTIDPDDASVLYVTPRYKLSSADTYNLVIEAGMKSAGAFSSNANCGFFETTAKAVDILSGNFALDGSTLSFNTKLTNTTNADKDLVIIAYAYEGTEFKGVASKTVTVKAGRNFIDSVDLPYYSPTAKIYALVTDDWSTMKPITNKLYSYSFQID